MQSISVLSISEMVIKKQFDTINNGDNAFRFWKEKSCIFELY